MSKAEEAGTRTGAARLAKNLIVAPGKLVNIVAAQTNGWNDAVLNLTKQQQLVICVTLFLLLTGWAVKTWRTAHPPAQAAVPAGP